MVHALLSIPEVDSSFSIIFGDGVKLCLVGVLPLLNGEEFAIGLNKLGEKGFGDDERGDDLVEALE